MWADIRYHAAPSRGEGGKIGADAKGRIAVQAALKQAGDQVIAHARKEPATALTAAAAFGFL